MKYRKGDKVIIHPNIKNMHNYVPSLLSSMVTLAGEKAIVNGYYVGDLYEAYTLEGRTCHWVEKWLLPDKPRKRIML